jgi:HEAT repeat protein
VHSDDATLPDDVDDLLVVAGHRVDGLLDEAVLRHLHDPLARRRVLALRAAQLRGLLHDDHWLAAIGDGDVDVRREALTLVASQAVGAPILERIVWALDDDDALVVDAAAFALGEHLHVGAVTSLINVAAHHEDARCRESAIAALGAIGDDRARLVILAALDDKPAVRRRAVVALANFEGAEIEAALEHARTDRDWQVRAAVDQLGRLEDPT